MTGPTPTKGAPTKGATTKGTTNMGAMIRPGAALRRYFRLAHRPFGWNGGLFAEIAGPDGSSTLVMNPDAHDRALKAAGRHLKRLAATPIPSETHVDRSR